MKSVRSVGEEAKLPPSVGTDAENWRIPTSGLPLETDPAVEHERSPRSRRARGREISEHEGIDRPARDTRDGVIRAAAVRPCARWARVELRSGGRWRRLTNPHVLATPDRVADGAADGGRYAADDGRSSHSPQGFAGTTTTVAPKVPQPQSRSGHHSAMHLTLGQLRWPGVEHQTRRTDQ